MDCDDEYGEERGIPPHAKWDYVTSYRVTYFSGTVTVNLLWLCYIYRKVYFKWSCTVIAPCLFTMLHINTHSIISTSLSGYLCLYMCFRMIYLALKQPLMKWLNWTLMLKLSEQQLKSLLFLSLRSWWGKPFSLIVRYIPHHAQAPEDLEVWAHTNECLALVRRHISQK